MEVFQWSCQSPPSPALAARRRLSNTVATLGIFDGLHVGHRKVIGLVVDAAERAHGTSVAVTFDRHPGSVIGNRPEPMITSLRHRLKLLEGLGLDFCLVIEFTDEIAGMEASDFVRTVLCDLLGVRLLIVGFDCRFGKDRRGNTELCTALGRELGFEATIVPPVLIGGQVVSSTVIRHAIARGELRRVERLLGRPYSLLGTVVHGDGRGIGYPTANLDLNYELLPPCGVYAARALLNDRPLAAVASVGTRSTFHHEPDAPIVVEVHVLDRHPDLYGTELEVQLLERIRDQQAFGSARELQEHIRGDIATARHMLAERTT